MTKDLLQEVLSKSSKPSKYIMSSYNDTIHITKAGEAIIKCVMYIKHIRICFCIHVVHTKLSCYNKPQRKKMLHEQES